MAALVLAGTPAPERLLRCFDESDCAAPSWARPRAHGAKFGSGGGGGGGGGSGAVPQPQAGPCPFPPIAAFIESVCVQARSSRLSQTAHTRLM